MLALRIIMPSKGDMELLGQEGGTIDLLPVFYGNEAAGPHIQVVELPGNEKEPKVISRFRLKMKEDGKIELKRGEVAK